jgi:heavy metal translocating P-type ATPase
MLKRVTKFLKEYREFSFAAIATLIGLILDLSTLDTAAHYVLAIAAGIVAIPLAVEMVKTLRSGHFGIDVLALTAIVTSIVLGQYWAAIIIVLMLTGGESLEDYAEKRATRELTSLISHRPKKAHLVKGRKTIDIRVSEINVGDKLTILPGEVIPVDATILEGTTSLNEASITGESVPVTKSKGDVVLSGSINIDGALTVKALHTAADSQYEQIIKLVRNATASHSPFVRLADRYSVPFTAISFMIAGATWFISGDALRFLEVLVVATPCPLLLGAPIAIISGMSRASKNGVIIKTGSALEQLAAVQTVAFDKTGTLTQGLPVVDEVKTYNKFSKEDVIKAAAALEQNSNHILAAAVTNYAIKQKIKFQGAKQVTELAGHGLRGRISGKAVLVGHRNLLAEEGVELPGNVKPESFKRTATYVAVGDQLAGVITFKDDIRKEAKGMLRRLRHSGVKKFALITGDNESTAVAVAQELNIVDVYPDCLPAQKMNAIEEMTPPVAFVGDGVNDAPVLTTADVGIALGARGSTAASETADVVIMHDDISRVATSVEIAKRTLFIAKQSVLIGIVISLALMIAFSSGKFTAVQGALIQELVDVIVIVNALRAHGPLRVTNG